MRLTCVFDLICDECCVRPASSLPRLGNHATGDDDDDNDDDVLEVGARTCASVGCKSRKTDSSLYVLVLVCVACS